MRRHSLPTPSDGEISASKPGRAWPHHGSEAPDLRPARRSSRPGLSPRPLLRGLDLLIAGLALVVFAPFMLLLALAVKLDGGPAFFTQWRLGQGEVPFLMFKFRSMRQDQEGPELTLVNDARVTRIGRFLRITSLDELPQLFNIIRGDMTLVGARPETLSLASRYPPQARAVFQYRPGLTGPTQLRHRDLDGNGSGTEDVEEYYLSELVPKRTALDLEYLSHTSLRDWSAILVETLAHVARRPLSLRRHFRSL